MTSRQRYVFLAAFRVTWAVAGCGFGSFSAPDASSTESFLAIEVAHYGDAHTLMSAPDDAIRVPSGLNAPAFTVFS